MVAQRAGRLNSERASPPGKDSPYGCQSPLCSETWQHDVVWPVHEGGAARGVENNSSLDVDLCLTRRTLRAHKITGAGQRRSLSKRSTLQGWRNLVEPRRSATPGLPLVPRASTSTPSGRRPSSLPATSPTPWQSPSPTRVSPSICSTTVPIEALSPSSAWPSSARSTPCKETEPLRPVSRAQSARGADSPAPPLRAGLRWQATYNVDGSYEASALPPRPGSQMQFARGADPRGEGRSNASTALGVARSVSRGGSTAAAVDSSSPSPLGAFSQPRSSTLDIELTGREENRRGTISGWTAGGGRPPTARSELVRWCFRNSREQIEARLSLLDRSTFSEDHRSFVYLQREGGLPESSEVFKLLRLYEHLGFKALPQSGNSAALEGWGVREGGCSRTSEILMAFEVLNFYRWLCAVPRLRIESTRQELADFMLHVLMKRDPRLHMRPEGAPQLCEFLTGFSAYVRKSGGRAVVVSQVPAAPAAVRLLFSGLPGCSSSSNEKQASGHAGSGAIGIQSGNKSNAVAVDPGDWPTGTPSVRGMPSHALHGADLPSWSLPGADARTEALELPLWSQDALRGYVPFLRLSRLGITDDSGAEASSKGNSAGGAEVVVAESVAGPRVRCVPVDKDDVPEPPARPTLQPSMSNVTTLRPHEAALLGATQTVLKRHRRTRAWGDMRGVVAFRRCILNPRLRTTGIIRRGCRTCIWTDTDASESLGEPPTSSNAEKEKNFPDANFLDPEPIEEAERLKSSDALQKLHGWREEMSRRLSPGVVTGAEGIMGFSNAAGDSFAEAHHDPWVLDDALAGREEQGSIRRNSGQAFVAQTTMMEEKAGECQKGESTLTHGYPEEEEPLIVCFPPPGIVPIDEIEVASLIWTISPDPQRLAPTSRCKIQVFRVSIDVPLGKADRTSDEEVPLGSFCVDCTDVGTPFCIIFSLGIEIEAGDQFEVVLSGLSGHSQPCEIVAALHYFVSFESFLPSVHQTPAVQQRASSMLEWLKNEFLWNDAQWHCPGEVPGEDEFSALGTASRASRALKDPTTFGSNLSGSMPQAVRELSKGMERFLSGSSSVHSAAQKSSGRASWMLAKHALAPDPSRTNDSTGNRALLGRLRPPQMQLTQRTEFSARSPPPFGLVEHPNGIGHPTGTQGRYTVEVQSGNEVSIALVVPSTVVVKASIMYFVKSSAKWETFAHGVFMMYMESSGGNEAPKSLLSLLDSSQVQQPLSPRKHRVLFRVMLPMAGRYELRFTWGFIPSDTMQCRGVGSAPAINEHPLRVAIVLGAKAPMYRPLVPTFFHSSTKRLGYPMKHPLAEHYGVTLMGPLRYRLRVGDFVRFTVLANQRKPVMVKTNEMSVEIGEGAALPSGQAFKNQEAVSALNTALAAIDAHAASATSRMRERSSSAASSGNDGANESSCSRSVSRNDVANESNCSRPPSRSNTPSGVAGSTDRRASRSTGGKHIRFKDPTAQEPSLENVTGSDRDVWLQGDGLKSDALLEAFQCKIAEQLQDQVRAGTAGQICVIAVIGTWRRVILLRRRLLEPPPPPPEIADLAATAGSRVAAEAALAAVARNTEVHEATVRITDEDQNCAVQLYVFQVGAAAEQSSSQFSSEEPGKSTPKSGARSGLLRGDSTTWQADQMAKKEDRPPGTAPRLGCMPPPARWCLAEFFVEGAHPLPYDEDEMYKPLPAPADPVEILGFDRPD